MANSSVVPPPNLAFKTEVSANWALHLTGVGVTLTLLYYAERFVVVVLISILLSFVLAPIVDLCTYLRMPRALGAATAMLFLLALIGSAVYYSSAQAINFADDVPKYANRVRNQLMRVRQQAETLQVLTPSHEKGVMKIRPTTDWTAILTHSFGSVSEAILLISFVPFLAYFMLSWQEHARSATVLLFPAQHRQTAYATLGLISAMIRTFMVGNLLLGLLIGLLSIVAFWLLHLPFFYFVGFISGFLSLVPYLGVLLALAPPLFVGIGHIEPQEIALTVFVVLGLHLAAMNILYPKFLGKRVQLNPLAVSLALLMWSILWGAIGLLLAIPITAAIKIVFDHVDSLKPLGNWLGES